MADNATGDDVASGGAPSSPDDTSSQGAGDLRSSQGAGNLRSSQGAGNLRGTTRIDDGVVAKIAGLSVREVPGVRAVGGGAARALGVLRERVSNSDLTQGIRVTVEDGQVSVDVTIVAEYPAPLQQVADQVRAAVYRAMEEMVGLDVGEVNIAVDDVYLHDEQQDRPSAPEPSEDPTDHPG